MFIALSFRFISVYPVPLLLCSRIERLYLRCKSVVLDCFGIWRRTFHTYGITSLQSLFSPSCKISYIRHYFEGHSQPCDTNNAGNVFFFFLVENCRRKKMLHSWYSAVTLKDGQNPHNPRRKAGHCFCRTTCSVAPILLIPRRQLRPPSFVNGCFIRLAYVPGI